jgi:hypothetical protein
MTTPIKPVVGRPDPDLLPGGGALVGIDGNAYAVMAEVARLLKYAGASRAYIEAYRQVAMSKDYDHLLATSVAYITPDE